MNDSRPDQNSLVDAPPRVRWLRVAGIGFGVLAATIILLLTWIINDQDRIRRAVEAGLTGLTDRQFNIAGEFDIEFGTSLTITASEVSWQNAVWSEVPNMLEVGWFRASVDLSSLFNMPVLLSDAEARDVKLWFEWQTDLPMNWVFKPAVDNETQSARPNPLPLLIDHARISNVSLNFRHPGLQDEISVLIPTAEHQQDADNNLVLNGDLIVRDRPLKLSGKIGPFPELAVAGTVIFDLLLNGELVRLDSNGRVDWLGKLQDPEVAFELTAPDAQALLDRLQLPMTTAGDIDLSAQVDMRDDNVEIVAAGNLGEFLFNADIGLKANVSLDDLNLAVTSSGPSARRLLSAAGIAGLTDEAYEVEIQATRVANEIRINTFRFDTRSLAIIADGTALASPHIRDFNLNLQATGQDVRDVAGLFGVASKVALPFSVNAKIVGDGDGQDDRLSADFRLGDITANMSGQLAERQGQSGSWLRFNLNADDITPLTDLFNVPVSTPTSLQLDGDIQLDDDSLVVRKLDGQLPASKFSTSGTVGILGAERPISLQVNWRGENLGAAIRRIDGAQAAPVPDLPFESQFSLAGTGNNFEFRNGNLAVGSSAVEFDARLVNDPGLRVNVNFTAAGSNLSELFTRLDIEGVPANPFTASGKLAVNGSTTDIREGLLKLPNALIKADISATHSGANIDFDIAASGTDLAAAFPGIGAWTPKSNAFNIDLSGSAGKSTVKLNQSALTIGEAQLKATGELTYAPLVRLNGIRLSAKGPRLSDLGAFGGSALADSPFSLTAALTGSPTNNDVEEIVLQVGRSNLRGDVDFDIDQDTPIINARLRSDFFDSDDIYIAAPDKDASNSETSAATPARNTLFPDKPLPTALIDRINGDFEARLKRLEIEEWVLNDITTAVRLEPGKASLDQLNFDTPFGAFDVTGSARTIDAGREVELNLQATQVRLKKSDMSVTEQDALPPHSIDMRLTGNGNSTRELLATANGYVWIIGGPGRSRRLNLGLLFGDFATELISAVNPIKRPEEYSNMQCQNVHFEIRDGIVKTSPAIALQTDNIRLLVDGELNLATEKIDFGLQTSARKGVGISVSNLINPFTKVSGTIMQPKIAIDEQGAIVQGGAAFATAGLSLFADTLWKRWISQRDICAKVGEKAIQERQARDPQHVPDLREMERNAGIAME